MDVLISRKKENGKKALTAALLMFLSLIVISIADRSIDQYALVKDHFCYSAF